MKRLSDVDCYEKETAVFECQLNYDDAQVTWFKDDKASSVIQTLLAFVVFLYRFNSSLFHVVIIT